jgi:hypothetical protein
VTSAWGKDASSLMILQALILNILRNRGHADFEGTIKNIPKEKI